MRNVTFRVDEEKLKQLDEIAKLENIDRSALLNNLIDYKIGLLDWQIAKIQKGIAQLDAGEYSKDTEIIKLLVD